MNKTTELMHTVDEAIVELHRAANKPQAVTLLPQTYLPAHKEGVGDVGRLTADAVAAEYDTAAKAVEAMGKDLVEMQRRLEAETQLLHEALDDVKALAALYREKAISAFNRIEQASLTIQDVRHACSEARERIQRT